MTGGPVANSSIESLLTGHLRAGDASRAAALVRSATEAPSDVALYSSLSRLILRHGVGVLAPLDVRVVATGQPVLFQDALTVLCAGDGLAVNCRAVEPFDLSEGRAAVPVGCAKPGNCLTVILVDSPGGQDPSDAESAVRSLVDLAARASSRGNGPVLIADVIPSTTGRGVRDERAASEINRRLREEAQRLAGVTVLDQLSLATRRGLSAWRDDRLAALGQNALTATASFELAREVAAFVRSWKGRARKLIAIDLDGVLWGGTLGEDSASGLCLGPAGPGRAYQDVQRSLRRLAGRGVILVAISKNDPGDAIRAMRAHPGMVLRPEDFARIEIGWRPKPDVLAETLASLGVSPAHAVFLDDNPVERAAARARSPDVLVPEYAGDPATLARRLLEDRWFDAGAPTAEDALRLASLQAPRPAIADRGGPTDREVLDDFKMVVRVSTGGAVDAARASQLSRRVTQFNATGIQYASEDVLRLINEPDVHVAMFELSDRYADHGRVGLIVLRRRPGTLGLETFLLSCRALGRGVETVMLAHAAERAKRAGLSLTGRIKTLPRNVPSRDLYAKHGFARMRAAEEVTDDAEEWTLPAPADVATPPYIQVTTD